MTVLRTAPARHRFAEFTAEQQTHVALIIEWQKIADDNGYSTWHAKLLYWDGEARVALIPHMRVRRV